MTVDIMKDFWNIISQQNHNQAGTIITKGPGKCLYQYLNDQEICEKCQHIENDWNIYSAIQEEEKAIIQQIQLEENKIIPIGKLEDNQIASLQQLLEENKDLFATSLQELQQTSVGEHIYH